MRCKSLLFACSVFALAAGSVQAAEWRLVEVSGTVRIAVPGAEAAPARLNQAVPTGSSVTTALGARAALDNGLQHIVVGPNSRMTVAPDAGGFTRVMQDLGAVMFKVDKQKVPHFRVDTPLLAAIVKGTTFTVVVGPQADSVNVAEGLVEVRANATDMASDVPAGSSGAVARDAPQSVQVTGTATSTSSEPVAMKIEPLDYKVVSGGLVDAGAPTMPAGEALAIASGNVSGDAVTGGEAATPIALATEVARNDHATEASASAGGNNANPAPTAGAGANGNGPSLPDVATPASGGSSGPDTGNNGAGNGNGGGPVGLPATTGNGDGNNGGGNGNGGGSTETGTNGNGAGNNGNGNGNGGSTQTGTPTTNGNGNGNNGNGNGNGGSTETGTATTTGNGNGNGNNGNGNGNGGSTDTGTATTTGNGNNGNGNGNGNGNNGNGNGNNGNGNGNGGSTQTGTTTTTGNGNGNNGNGNGGLVGGLINTVGGVTEGLLGAGKGRGPK